MSLDAAAKSMQDTLGGRAFLVGAVPFSAATAFVLVLVWAGAPGTLEFSKAWRTASSLSIVEVVLLVLGVVLLAVASQPLQLRLVRLLEGYWPDRAERLTELARRRHRKRREAMAAAERSRESTAPSQDEINRIGRAGTALRRRYPIGGDVVPTAFGNVLAAAEKQAGAAYGWDAVVAWPRLYPVLGAQTRSVVAARRDLLDVTARMTIVCAATTVAAVVLLAACDWWLLLAAAPAGLAWLSYRSSLEAGSAYGEAMALAFDLHRFDLLNALHLHLPADLDEERRLTATLSRSWRQGTTPPGTYHHLTPPAAAEQPKAAEQTNTADQL